MLSNILIISQSELVMQFSIQCPQLVEGLEGREVVQIAAHPDGKHFLALATPLCPSVTHGASSHGLSSAASSSSSAAAASSASSSSSAASVWFYVEFSGIDRWKRGGRWKKVRQI